MTLRPKALALSLLFTLPAFSQSIPDPANLMGERVSPQSPADTLEINHGAPALQQLLLKLRTRASLMMIVAHPDDEDGGMLTYESRGLGARVAMLTLTRGEGGQNLMTADFNDALGLIRTQELLAEDRLTGTDQFFGTEIDFGFSKTKEEAFQQWTHDRVLYDAVRAVRLYRPLILASVFVGGVTDGHGHHQVSGEICQEVFLAAADPKVFPEMGLPPWAPLKVYARVPFSRVTPQGMFDYATGKYTPPLFHNYVTGQDITHEPSATVQIHEGDPATVTFPGHPATPTLGMEGLSYVQFARKGLALQKTQIGSNVRLAPPGPADSAYTLIASRLSCATSGCPTLDAASSRQGGVSGDSPTALPSQEPSLFTGIDTSLPSLATLTPNPPPSLKPTLTSIDHNLAEAQRLFDPAHLDLTAPPLREALRTLDTLIAQTPATSANFNLLHELRIKRVQLNNALLLASGIAATATLAETPRLLTTAPTASINLKVQNAGESPAFLTQLDLSIAGADSAISTDHLGTAAPHASVDLQQKIPSLHRSAKETAIPPTQPYFSRSTPEQPFYDISNPALRNAPETPAPIRTSIDARPEPASGQPLKLIPAVTGTPYQPAAVIPPISVSLSPRTGIIRPQEKQITVYSHLTSTVDTEQHGTIRLEVPTGWTVSPAEKSWTLSKSAPDLSIPFTVSLPAVAQKGVVTLTAEATLAGRAYKQSFRPVGYPGLPTTNYYTLATYKAVAVDVTTAPNLRIAYLPGTGDSTADFLPNLGITPTTLTLADLTPTTLAKYDALLVGVRAYAAHPELAGPGSKPLLDYAANGGIVILQYMTARFGDSEAPFPISIPGDSAHNVVVESQPVRLLDPRAPLLTWPNTLTPADFTGWTEEWGHGFASTWSPRYTPLLEVHDPDQDPQQGGLLLARTGKGAYIYCALALYRQLPEGVPGAYRLLANLLSYAKNPLR